MLLRLAWALLAGAMFYAGMAPYPKGSVSAGAPRFWRSIHFTLAALGAGMAVRKETPK